MSIAYCSGLAPPLSDAVGSTWRRKNTETRNIIMPSYEIFAPSCEIIMKIVKYCGKIMKKQQNNNQ